MYCANCENKATHFAVHKDPDSKTPLCATCAEAYEWGQAYPEASVEPIAQEKDEE